MARGAPLTRGARRSQAPRGGTRNGRLRKAAGSRAGGEWSMGTELPSGKAGRFWRRGAVTVARPRERALKWRRRRVSCRVCAAAHTDRNDVPTHAAPRIDLENTAVTWKKPDARGHRERDPIHTRISRTGEPTEAQSGCRGLGGGGVGAAANGGGCLLGWRECSGARRRWPRLHGTVNELNATEQSTLEMVNFTLCEFRFDVKTERKGNPAFSSPLSSRAHSLTGAPSSRRPRACRDLHLPPAPEARASPEPWEPPQAQRTLARVPGEAGGNRQAATWWGGRATVRPGRLGLRATAK